MFGISGFASPRIDSYVEWFNSSLERRCIWPNASAWSVGHNIQLIALGDGEVLQLVSQDSLASVVYN